MAKALSIDLTVTSVRKEEDRSGSKGAQITVSASLCDEKQMKNLNEKNWSPYNNVNIYVVDDPSFALNFGKKYRITFEEIE